MPNGIGKKETSPRVSHLAQRYMQIQGVDVQRIAAENADALADDIRTLAASALSQDETKGQS